MWVTVLGVATSAGAYGVGQEDAPRELRRAGLLDALATHGLAVTDEGDSTVTRFAPDPSNRTAQNLHRVVGVVEDVAARVGSVVRRGSLPLVLGGDCTITLGVAAGVASAGSEPALAYVDGDVDLSTPATTGSGILDAMGVGHMLDLEGAAESLASVGGRRPLIDGSRLALIGYEEVSAAEAAILEARGVHRFPASEVRDGPSTTAARAVAALGDERPLIVHFDVDVIDSIDCPLAHFPHFNTGVALTEAKACLSTLCAAPNLAAVVVTEVNPLHDPDRTQLPRLVDTLATAVSATPARGVQSGT